MSFGDAKGASICLYGIRICIARRRGSSCVCLWYGNIETVAEINSYPSSSQASGSVKPHTSLFKPWRILFSKHASLLHFTYLSHLDDDTYLHGYGKGVLLWPE